MSDQPYRPLPDSRLTPRRRQLEAPVVRAGFVLISRGGSGSWSHPDYPHTIFTLAAARQRAASWGFDR